ncbi:hypothetical protein [uncultured Psychroserpens sp.]|uniref:hypothetical protein n=1 Tax=uncultured Psychroserpens sp. TaxID=255436 RepID=UPI0026066F8D|nr:hypothetical protein [uncultured Psychroserpens sp.]
MAKKGGLVKGKYNAWSFLIFGKIERPESWDLMYKKSTFTNSGNLLLSAKNQGLLTMATWSTTIANSGFPSFSIRKRKKRDLLRILLSKNVTALNIGKGYILEAKSGVLNPSFYDMVLVLKPLFEDKKIYTINFKKNKLTIELRSENHHFDVFDNILDIFKAKAKKNPED